MTWKEMSEVKPSSGRLGEGGELLRDADVAGAGGDADADPDRPEREERREEELGEQLRRVEDDAR